MPDIPGIARVGGPLLFAVTFNWGLLGVLIAQVYLYYVSFPGDSWVVKGPVYAIFTLELLQTILITKTEFKSLAINFGNPKALDNVDIVWFSVPMMSGIVASIAQGFYAYRLWVMTKSKLVGVIILLSLAQLGGALAEGVLTKQSKLYSHLFSNNFKNAFISTGIWDASSALCDILIAVLMTINLQQRKTAFKRTQDLVSRIISTTIRTGTFTALVAISALTLVFLPGHPTYYQACVAVLGKAYSNSMLVMVNSRIKVFSDSKLVWNKDARPGPEVVSENLRFKGQSISTSNIFKKAQKPAQKFLKKL